MPEDEIQVDVQLVLDNLTSQIADQAKSFAILTARCQQAEAKARFLQAQLDEINLNQLVEPTE